MDELTNTTTEPQGPSPAAEPADEGHAAPERAVLPSAPKDAYQDEAMELLSEGYCLWLGAGVGRQIADGTGFSIPLWSRLVDILQPELDRRIETDSLSLPERLQLALNNLTRNAFQRRLRTLIAVPMAQAALHHLDEWAGTGEMPEILDQLALFGALSNSVVNFNVESVSSRLIAAASPYALKVFHPPTEGTSGFRQYEGKFDRRAAGDVPLNIFHPHGAIDVGGRCVMTSEEYRSLDGTLGLELAVHSCFGENVLILGMSLDDDYLRRQLVNFRNQIRRIIWVSIGAPPPKTEAWAAVNGIQVMSFEQPSELWGLFTRYRSRGPAAMMPIPWYDHRRRARVARRLAREARYLVTLASDVSVETARALDALREPQPNLREEGARLVRAADLGEDPEKRGKLPSGQLLRAKEIEKKLAEWAKAKDPDDQ